MTKGKKKIKSCSNAPEQKTLYFGPQVQCSMEKYYDEQDIEKKHVIYIEEIMPAFNKLVENLIYIYGFSKTIDSVIETRTDCVSFLYENMHKFDPRRGTKAFSYFNVVARNWLIINSKKKQKEIYRNVSIDDPFSMSKFDKSVVANYSVAPSPDDVLIERNKKNELLEMFDKISLRLNEENEKQVMSALKTVFENVDDLDLLNKRAIFLYLREMLRIDQKRLSASMTIIRKHYRDLVIENRKEL